MHTFQTAGAPPNSGKSILPIIGSSRNRSAAARKTVQENNRAMGIVAERGSPMPIAERNRRPTAYSGPMRCGSNRSKGSHRSRNRLATDRGLLTGEILADIESGFAVGRRLAHERAVESRTSALA